MKTTDADPFAARTAQAGATLGAAGRRVAAHIARNRAGALGSSAADIARATGTSDATVIRTVQALGYAGMAEMKRDLVAGLEAEPGVAADLRRTLAELRSGAGHAIDLVLGAHEEAIATLRSAAFATALAAAVGLLHPAGRIVVFGVGPSGALARYAATLLARAGRRSRVLDATGFALADQLLDLQPGDALLALAYGRIYREVAAVFDEARRLAVPIVLVTGQGGTAMVRAADGVLLVPRGRGGRMALHGGTLVALEALVLALAAEQEGAALAAVARLDRLRAATTPDIA